MAPSPKADLGELWVEYASLSSRLDTQRDACTENACAWFIAWGFNLIESRILACLFLKPREFNQLQWDVGFDAGDKKQVAKVRKVLERLLSAGYLVEDSLLRFSEHWRPVFLVVNPENEQQLRGFGVTTPSEMLSRCRPAVVT